MSAGEEINYRPRGRLGALRVGAHPSRAVGSLGTFRDQVPFMAYPDARRIDVRATLRDPFGNTFVRRFHQRAAVDVYALVDLSGSLDYEGKARKSDLVVALCAALARAATRVGDRFGLVGCDATIREDCLLPPTKRSGIVAEVTDRLARAPRSGASAQGLLEAAERLTGTRKMVFVISDFQLPLALLRRVFEQLAGHDVIPVIVGDSSEELALPDWGLMELADLETGERRLVFMRPAFKARWLAQGREHAASVVDLARQFGRTPVSIKDSFDAEHFSHDLWEA